MSFQFLYRDKKKSEPQSRFIAFKAHYDNSFLSADKFGSICTVKINPNRVGNNETFELIPKNNNSLNSEDDVYHIRSHHGHYLTFDLNDSKLCCQKFSSSITSWKKHKSHVYAKFSFDDLHYFTPSTTAGIIGASGISVYGNKFLCCTANGTVSNKLIPGKYEMWILTHIKPNTSSSLSNLSSSSLKTESKSPNLNAIKAKTSQSLRSLNCLKTEEKKDSFEDKLHTISHLVASNIEALNVYKTQINFKTIKVGTMKEWEIMYNRFMTKRTQWKMHQNEFKLDIDEFVEYKDESNEAQTPPHNELDICKSLDHKYNEKWKTLGKLKEKMVKESKVLKELNHSNEATMNKLTEMNDEIKEYDDEIDALQRKINELKQKRSEVENEVNNHIMPLVATHEKCVESALKKLKNMNVGKIHLEKALTSIKETTHSINKFDEDMRFIVGYLENEFKTKFEPNWMQWSTEDVLVWLRYLNAVYDQNEEFAFKNEQNKGLLMNGVRSSNLAGKDLKNINDLILRSFDIKDKEDRDLILKCLNMLMCQMDTNSNEQDTKTNDEDEDEVTKDQDRQCVICMDNTANMMFMPCNHIAVCHQCDASNTLDKCAFCGNAIDKIIKCYHVGF